VWSTAQQQVIASGVLESIDELEQLTDVANNRVVIGVLDASDVSLKSVETPKVSTRQLTGMLPFLLEDDIAQDPDQVHVTLLHRDNDDKTGPKAQVAIVDKSLIDFWMLTLQSVGIELKKLLPDVTALGASSPKSQVPVMLSMGSQWLVHHSNSLGAVIDNAQLTLALSSDIFAPYRAQPESGDVLVHLQQDQSFPDNDIQWTAAEPELGILVLAKGAIASPVNLLSGLYKKPSLWRKHVRVWSNALIAAVVLLGVFLGQSYWQVNQLQSQADAYQQARVDIVRKVLPDRRNFPTVSYLKRLMEDEVLLLNGGSVQQGLLEWLRAVPKGLDNNPNIDITALKFDANREELRLDVVGPDFQSFETIRENFAKYNQVEQGSLSRSSDGKVSGQFVLKVNP
jgi:general secretion pathway protein L